MNASTPHSPATSPSVRDPSTLFFTASVAFVSIKGTCLCAAACATTETPCSRNTDTIRSRSPTSPTTGTIDSEGHASRRSRSTV